MRGPSAQELANHGPAKPPGKEGIDRYTNEDGSLKDGVDEDQVDLSVKYAHYNEDPQGQRTGDAPAPELAAVIRKQCAEASAAVDANQVDAKVPMTAELIIANKVSGSTAVVWTDCPGRGRSGDVDVGAPFHSSPKLLAFSCTSRAVRSIRRQ